MTIYVSVSNVWYEILMLIKFHCLPMSHNNDLHISSRKIVNSAKLLFKPSYDGHEQLTS